MHYEIALSLKGTCEAFLEFVQKRHLRTATSCCLCFKALLWCLKM